MGVVGTGRKRRWGPPVPPRRCAVGSVCDVRRVAADEPPLTMSRGGGEDDAVRTTTVSLSCAVLGLLAACGSGEPLETGGFTSLTSPVTTPMTSVSEGVGSTTTSPTSGPTSGGGSTDATDASDTRSSTGHVGGTETAGTTEGPPPPPEPSCDDGLLNQDESDVDCGGTICGGCSLGGTCKASDDCASDSCIAGVCTDPNCMDGAKNADESDVDCGGGCGPCADNLGCAAPADCSSGVCTNMVCTPPACGDGVKNGAETETDCGGGTCMGCGEGQVCAADPDCLSGFCSGGKCAPKECDSDANCGQFNSACTKGVCNALKKCEAQNSNEGGACDDGNKCSTGEKCSAGTCGGAAPVDCSAMSNQCALGVCDANSGSCVAQAANEGNPCNDGNGCTVAEVCSAATCKDPNNPNGYVFYEPFANNNAGWQLGTEWGIGSAQASIPGSGNPDPSVDHTATADNGIAGVVIGGNATTVLHDYYYLTSPVINTAAIPGTAWLSLWRWLNSDYNNYMDNRIEVFNGNTWTAVFSGPACCSPIYDNQWSQQSFDVTAYKNANFRFRIGHKIGAGGAFTVGSWNVDDVVVGPAVCSP